MLGYYFGIPKEKLVVIEVDNKREEHRVDLLETWYKQEGRRATYLKLMSGLHERGCCDLIEFLCGKIKSSYDARLAYENQKQSNQSGMYQQRQSAQPTRI